jgi:hypothetical protein
MFRCEERVNYLIEKKIKIQYFTPRPVGTSPKLGGCFELLAKWLLYYQFQILCIKTTFKKEGLVSWVYIP